MRKQKKEKIEGVSVYDLAVSYSTEKVYCAYYHADGYAEYHCGLVVLGLRKAKNFNSSPIHLVVADLQSDMNRPGEDASARLEWNRVYFRFNEVEQIGELYYPQRRRGKKK